MSYISRLKNIVFQNPYPEQKSIRNIGFSFFQIGVLFLAIAPVISFILLIISSVLGSFKREENYIKNYFFVYLSLAK